jgi:hypothetical protein
MFLDNAVFVSPVSNRYLSFKLLLDCKSPEGGIVS